MHKYNVEAGDLAVIIDSANGEKGPSVGREVIVLAFREGSTANYDIHHQTLGKIWPIRSRDGQPLYTEHGGSGMEIDCADRWLRKIEPVPPTPEKKKVEEDLGQSA